VKTLSAFFGFFLKQAANRLKQISPNEPSRDKRVTLLRNDFNLSAKRAQLLLATLEHIQYDTNGVNQVIVSVKNDQADAEGTDLPNLDNLSFEVKKFSRNPTNPIVSEALQSILSLRPTDLHQKPLPTQSQISQRVRLLREEKSAGLYTLNDNATDDWVPARAWVLYSNFSGRTYDVDYAFEYDGHVSVHTQSYEFDFMHLSGELAEWTRAFMAAKAFTVLINPKKPNEAVVFDL
jgi:hypothetical protein